MKIIVITDNEYLFETFFKISTKSDYDDCQFDFYFSYFNKNFKSNNCEIKPIKIKDKVDEIIEKYDLLISLHCKQIFPSELVNNIRCVNIHPGYNPYNRGWYPQVFSIINKMPVGVTIHEIDEELDHGKIIVQEKIKIESWDTSFEIYKKIQIKEIEMIKDNLRNILDKNYETKNVEFSGNVNLKEDFQKICKLDLNEKLTMREAIDKLRALSHGEFNNAFFYDDYGNKIYLKIKLEREKNE